jgi:hypothetical protein
VTNNEIREARHAIRNALDEMDYAMGRSRRSLGIDTSAAADIAAGRLVADVTKGATRHATATEAARRSTATVRAIRLSGACWTAHVADCHRLEAAGISFAYLSIHDGRLCSVPVN